MNLYLSKQILFTIEKNQIPPKFLEGRKIETTSDLNIMLRKYALSDKREKEFSSSDKVRLWSNWKDDYEFVNEGGILLYLDSMGINEAMIPHNKVAYQIESLLWEIRGLFEKQGTIMHKSMCDSFAYPDFNFLSDLFASKDNTNFLKSVGLPEDNIDTLVKSVCNINKELSDLNLSIYDFYWNDDKKYFTTSKILVIDQLSVIKANIYSVETSDEVTLLNELLTYAEARNVLKNFMFNEGYSGCDIDGETYFLPYHCNELGFCEIYEFVRPDMKAILNIENSWDECLEAMHDSFTEQLLQPL
jgi:hypothetical protein